MAFLESFWSYLIYTAPFLIFGLAAAGLIHGLINMDFITKHLGGTKLSSVFKASLFGIPLPLCSCAVIPAAVSLKKKGASNGAVCSFLISTPESGVDSIAATYALMDLPMTVIRPLAAFLTSLIAGAIQNSWNFFESEEEVEAKKGCCSKEKPKSFKLMNSLSYGFGKLANDIAFWLTIGLIVGGVLDYFVPADYFQDLNGLAGRLIILFIGIPLYICASASTPIAASMVLKGMSPGASLLFLLVGPATNVSNIAVLQKYIGKKGVIIQVCVIAIVSLLLSYLVDWGYSSFHLPIEFKLSDHHHNSNNSIFSKLMAVFLIFLLIKGIWKEEIAPRLSKEKGSCH